MKRTLLIDGDIVVYKYSTIAEHEVNWGDDVWSLWADAKEVKELILNYTELLVEKTAADDFIYCFSDKDNFRKGLYPAYKFNRKGKRKPTCYVPIKTWLEGEYQTKQLRWLEGDDVMGILATSGFYEETVVVSDDKDMLSVPGLLWRNEELMDISQEEADYYHLYQTLVGDTTDGYGGLKGVGDKKATELLKTPTWDTVKTAYEKAGHTEEDALVQARLAKILRASEYDYDTGEIKLWHP